jgi:hypothetical protein
MPIITGILVGPLPKIEDWEAQGKPVDAYLAHL